MTCVLCDDAGVLKYWREGLPVYEDCHCTVEKRREGQKQANLTRSGMSPYMRNEYTFARWQRVAHSVKYKDQVQVWIQRPETSLVLIGPYGSGKTYLAAAAINHRLDQGYEARFVFVPDLLDDLKLAMDKADLSSVEIKRQYADTPDVLALDDLAGTRVTDWSHDELFSILNHRLTEGLPVLATTNLKLDSLPKRIASRLSLGTVIEIAP